MYSVGARSDDSSSSDSEPVRVARRGAYASSDDDDDGRYRRMTDRKSRRRSNHKALSNLTSSDSIASDEREDKPCCCCPSHRIRCFLYIVGILGIGYLAFWASENQKTALAASSAASSSSSSSSSQKSSSSATDDYGDDYYTAQYYKNKYYNGNGNSYNNAQSSSSSYNNYRNNYNYNGHQRRRSLLQNLFFDPFRSENKAQQSPSHAQTIQKDLEPLVRAQGRRLAEETKEKTRMLYIITTLAEYNTGSRSTEKGSDRLQNTLIPVMTESVNSMIEAGYDVDVFLVCHFKLTKDREALVRQALPTSVKLETWYDATPIGYDTAKKFRQLEYRTLHLARQHRFVIKDKLLHYDMFACFEDDMIIHGSQVNHFRAVTAELFRLREAAPDDVDPPETDPHDVLRRYHGPLTKGQLKRMIPGFIRVEALLDEAQHGAQRNTGPVPIDLSFDGTERRVNPVHCCHVSEKTATSPHIPLAPKHDDLMLWETNIFPLGIRQMPAGSWLDWVVLQRGPSQKGLPINQTIGDYWTNRNGDYYGKQKRPIPLEFRYINNQGGWMATREQLWEWHTEICPGGFLPPYEPPHYRYDGLDMRNVEWYSGAMQLSTVRHACNMQRIILLDPENFSKSLLYHSANNKQRQLAGQGKREHFTKADTLLGQLNTLKKRALAEMHSL